MMNGSCSKTMEQEAQCLKEKGNECFKRRQFSQAVQFYTQALHLDPTEPVIFANRAQAFLKIRQPLDAKVDCDAALALDGTFVKAWYRRGVAYLNLGLLDAARADFLYILQLDPSNTDARKELAGLQVPVGRQQNTAIEIHAVDKAENMKSKKELRRVPVRQVPEEKQKEEKQREEKQEKQKEEKQKEEKQGQERQREEKQKENQEEKLEDQVTKDQQKAVDDLAARLSQNGVTQESNVPNMISGDELPSIPPPPTSGYQLLIDYRILKDHPSLFARYFLGMDSGVYPEVLGSLLDSDMLGDLVRGLALNMSDSLICNDRLLEKLYALTLVPRFDLAVMFWSNKERNAMRAVLTGLEEMGDTGQLSSIASAFGV